MATRKFADDDAALNVGAIITARSRKYSDLTLSWDYNSDTGDLYISRDAFAVKQSIKNLILTDHGERPFQPYLGSGIRGLLFELADDLTQIEIDRNCRRTIENYEPRTRILDIIVKAEPDSNNVSVRLEFQVISTTELVVLEISLERIR